MNEDEKVEKLEKVVERKLPLLTAEKFSLSKSLPFFFYFFFFLLSTGVPQERRQKLLPSGMMKREMNIGTHQSLDHHLLPLRHLVGILKLPDVTSFHEERN
jgi:hypothetical protein